MTELPPPPIGWESPAGAINPPVPKKQAPNPKLGCAVLLGLFIIVFGLIAIVGSLGSDAPKKHAKWKANFVWEVSEIVDPATIKFWAVTKNVGKAAAVPHCMVTLNSANGSYHGFDSFDLDRIAPGHEQRWNGLVTVTGQGAQYVLPSESSIICEDAP